MKERDFNSKELNLLDLLKIISDKIVLLLKETKQCIGKTLQLAYRHKVLFGIMIILAIGIGLFRTRASQNIYTTDAMIKLYGVKAHTVIKMSEQLSLEARLLNKKRLAQRLNLHDSVVNKIISIHFYSMIDYNKNSIPNTVDFNRSHSLEDTVNVLMSDYVYLQFKLIQSTANAEEIGKAIVDFINQKPFIQSSFTSYKNNLTERLNLCNRELQRLDSLSNKKYFEKTQKQIELKNNQLLVGSNKVQLFYDDILELYGVKSKTKAKLLATTAPLKVTTGFIIDSNSMTWQRRLKIVAKIIILSLFLSLIMAFILENRKKWIDFLNQK